MRTKYVGKNHEDKLEGGTITWLAFFDIYKDGLEYASFLFANRKKALNLTRRKFLKEDNMEMFSKCIDLAREQYERCHMICTNKILSAMNFTPIMFSKTLQDIRLDPQKELDLNTYKPEAKISEESKKITKQEAISIHRKI